jgi:hypothetical protein
LHDILLPVVKRHKKARLSTETSQQVPREHTKLALCLFCSPHICCTSDVVVAANRSRRFKSALCWNAQGTACENPAHLAAPSRAVLPRQQDISPVCVGIKRQRPRRRAGSQRPSHGWRRVW